jgi:D-alanyl-D-alanine carboxypeptidase
MRSLSALRSCLGLLAACFALAGSSFAVEPPPGLPNSAAGQRLAAYLEAFNDPGEANDARAAKAANDAKLERFLAAAFSPAALAERPLAARLAFHRQVRDEHGRFEIVAIVEQSDRAITVRVRGAKSSEEVSLGLELEAAPSHFVRGFRIELGGPAGPSGSAGSSGPHPSGSRHGSEPERAAETTPLTVAEARTALDAAIAEAAAADRFSGVVAVRRVERGSITPFSERAVGLADRERRIANRVDTRFNLGSIVKIFTKTLIARLVQDGKLRLDDTLLDVLPHYPNRELASRVTIAQLVAHTSGMGDIFGEEFRRRPHTLRSLADYVGIFVDRPLSFEPGARFGYSNAGYVVLGRVIEEKTGLSYDEALKRFVLDPAAMTATSLDAVENDAPDRAVGYFRPDGPGGAWKPNRDVLPGRGSSAGGGYSIAADLFRFVDALRADRLTSFAWTEWVLGGNAPEGTAATSTGPHTRGLGIAGGAEGINAVLLWQGDGSGFVVLANLDEPAAEEMARTVRGIVGRIPPGS